MRALVTCCLLGLLAAAGVNAAGGGVNDPAGGTCDAGAVRAAGGDVRRTPGCNPDVGKLFGRCVEPSGTAWDAAPSACSTPVPGTPRAEGETAAPAPPAVCGASGMDAVLATIRTQESGGRYAIGPNAGGASGAYQFIKGTWNGTAKRAGRPDLVGVWPYQASPADQDALARQLVAEALGGTDDITRIPVVWYIGHIPRGAEWDTVPHPEAGNRLTPRQYQKKWMDTYRRAGGTCET